MKKFGLIIITIILFAVFHSGISYAQQSHQYDTDQNWAIGDFELLAAIDVWAAGNLNDFGLLDLIDFWAYGSYCWDSTESKYKRSNCAAGNPSYTFTGGTLNNLLAVSPTLTFNNLTIAGSLDLKSGSASREYVFNVNNFTITSQGSIGVDWRTCTLPFGDEIFDKAPDLTIIAAGDVSLNGPIDLEGRPGFIDDGDLCDRSWGSKGGTVTIDAAYITVNSRIDLHGGASGYELITVWACTDWDWNTLCVGINKDGGDAGDLILTASSTLTITANGAIKKKYLNGGAPGDFSFTPSSFAYVGFRGRPYFTAPNISV